MNSAPVLLVIGIHREELAFGQMVAEGLNKQHVKVLTVPEGLSGKRPLADQEFKYETLHRALYLQLLPYVQDKHALLLDLHSGSDPAGPSADLICADVGLCTDLAAQISNNASLAQREVRVIPLGNATAFPHAHTVIPKQIWNNPAFTYLGMEIYLPDTTAGQAEAGTLARELVTIVTELVTRQPQSNSAQQRLTMGAQMHTQTSNEQTTSHGMAAFLTGRRQS